MKLIKCWRQLKNTPQNVRDAMQGRSMVEMLGVLAIIGILSIGAISGYQKAMFKYKLNKQAEQFNTIMIAVTKNIKKFPHKTQWLEEIFIKMGEIPTDMITNNTIHDVFNTQIGIRYEVYTYVSVIDLYVSLALDIKSDHVLQICKNIIQTTRIHSADLRRVYTISGFGSEEQTEIILQGDSFCYENQKCLKNTKLEDIELLCTHHIAKKGAHLKIEWLV